MIYTIALETNQQVFPYKALVVGSFMVNLVLIFAKYAFEQYVNFRQLQRYTVKKLPSEVARLRINQEQFTRSQNYSFDKLAFEMYVLSLKIALDCLLILCNIMPLVWDSVINIFFFIDPNSEFQRGLCFLIIESLKAKTFEVPISLYQTFVIEKKYDYTNKTFQLFVYDLIVECALMLIILPPILYGYLQVVDAGGEYFYLSVEIFVVLVTLLLTWVYPNFIAPLFNDFRELDHQSQLRQGIQTLADKVGFPLRNIYTMNGSVRSSHSNAYFYGFGSNRRIVLYDTLVHRLDQKEVVSVVGHELGHWKHQHALLKFVLYVFQVLCIFYIFSFFRNNDSIFISFGFKQKSTFIGTALFFSLFDPISSVFELLNLILSRYFEFQADQFACSQGLGKDLFRGLRKLFRESATCMTPDSVYSWFRHSHPTIHERIDRIKLVDPDIISSKQPSVSSNSQKLD